MKIDTNVAPETKVPAKRIKSPPRDKSHFEETTPRYNFRIKETLHFPRCQAYRRGLDEQCNMIACTKRGHNVCRSHGGARGIGKRSETGEQARLDVITTHGKTTQEAVAKRNKRTKQHRTLTKIAVALDLAPYKKRGLQSELYPKTTLASLPALIKELEE